MTEYLSLMGGEPYSDQIKTLNNGWRVLARPIAGRTEAYKFANVTQAKEKASLYPGAWVSIDRPFYVRVPDPA